MPLTIQKEYIFARKAREVHHLNERYTLFDEKIYSFLGKDILLKRAVRQTLYLTFHHTQYFFNITPFLFEVVLEKKSFFYVRNELLTFSSSYSSKKSFHLLSSYNLGEQHQLLHFKRMPFIVSKK